MDRRHLQAVWKLATDAGPPAPDAELLRRFARDRDDDAFTELVRRHGRLVWALCRNLLPCESDADDAFQATFLVLARSAGSVRDAARLGPWLHGVAYRVCLKARWAAARRKRHELAAAAAEAGRPVADAAWDAALAAVHEEVARLPDALRVAFVMCCLEGKGATNETTGRRGARGRRAGDRRGVRVAGDCGRATAGEAGRPRAARESGRAVPDDRGPQ